MEAKQFGIRLRELRNKSGMTQRELAQKVGVDFSYLSKIESGAVPPPSPKVISRIAMALKADENELITLAGRIPPDIAQTLRKSMMTQRLIRVSNKLREGTEMSFQNLKRVKNSRVLSRVAISLVMVMLISASLFFASPVSALTITITNPTTGTLGSDYSFSVTVNIEESERLPITDITAYIYKADSRSSYQATLAAMPLKDDTKSYTTSQTGGGAASVTAAATTGWEGGYNYGYRTATFEGNPSFWGYGVGYAYSVDPTSITYDITWTSPSTWPSGTYTVETKITAVTTEFTKTGSTVTLSAVVTATGGGGTTTSNVMTTNLFGTQGSVYIDRTTGVVASTVTATSADGNLMVTIPAGTTALTRFGIPLTSMSSNPVTPPSPPAGASVIGLAYDFGSDGATFEPPIEFEFTYDPAALPADVDEADLVIAYYDEATSSWVTLTSTVDTVTNTITAQVSHFTTFTILAIPEPLVPAAFTVSDITISPATVNVKETVNISTTISNTGDIAGSYYVALTINGVPIATKAITLASGASQTITFTASGDVAGTYSVDINGKTGQFTVEAAAVVTPPTPEPPTPEPPTPTPPTPTPTPPEIPSTNWWLIGGIIAGVAVIVGVLFWFILNRESRIS